MTSFADETQWMDATDQAALVARRDATPVELLDAAIERIERIDPALNAVVIRWFEHAREVAASPDLPDGPFKGVPFLLKDLWATYAGQRISNGNVALKNANTIFRIKSYRNAIKMDEDTPFHYPHFGDKSRVFAKCIVGGRAGDLVDLMICTQSS